MVAREDRDCVNSASPLFSRSKLVAAGCSSCVTLAAITPLAPPRRMSVHIRSESRIVAFRDVIAPADKVATNTLGKMRGVGECERKQI